MEKSAYRKILYLLSFLVLVCLIFLILASYPHRQLIISPASQDLGNSLIFWYTVATFLMLLVVLGAAFFALRQLEALSEANTFAALTRIHEVMSGRASYEIRRYLHRQFPEHLMKAVREVFSEEEYKDLVTENGIDICKVLKIVKPDQAKKDKLSEKLQSFKVPIANGNITALDAVEWTLLDYDIIVLPVYIGIKSAEKVAEVYGPVLKDTAPKILPFVAIQYRLRNSDSAYKKPYLWLLAIILSQTGKITIEDKWKSLTADSGELILALNAALQEDEPSQVKAPSTPSKTEPLDSLKDYC